MRHICANLGDNGDCRCSVNSGNGTEKVDGTFKRHNQLIAGGSLLGLTILAGLVCYIMCLGISAMLTYILLATLVAPALIEMGISVIAAHFFIIYMGLSGFFTPPLEQPAHLS